MAATKKKPVVVVPFSMAHIINESCCYAMTGHGTQCHIKILNDSSKPIQYTCKRHSNREDEIRTYMNLFKENAKGRDYANKSGYDYIGSVPGRVNIRLNGRWYYLDTIRLWLYETNKPDERPIGSYVGQQLVAF